MSALTSRSHSFGYSFGFFLFFIMYSLFCNVSRGVSIARQRKFQQLGTPLWQGMAAFVVPATPVAHTRFVVEKPSATSPEHRSAFRNTSKIFSTTTGAPSFSTTAAKLSPLTEGCRVPSCEWPIRKLDGGSSGSYVWAKLTTDDVFKGKRVVVFSLPGAFTPTCSSTHLPNYEKLYGQLKNTKGQKTGKFIDGVYCLAVNDTFVMNAWKKQLNIQNVEVIPDGNGEFSSGMGLLVGKDNIGFGKRSWRYSMVVDNGKIEKMFIEPGLGHNAGSDPFEVSGAENMLQYLQAA